MSFSGKFCLKWEDFRENVGSAFHNLWQDTYFSDVTLVSEDKQHITTHKVVLAASSSLFREILKQNKHPHPLIYMRGIKAKNLESVVEFMYRGEVKICKNDINDFLVVATEFDIKGLTESNIAAENNLETENNLAAENILKTDNSLDYKPRPVQVMMPFNLLPSMADPILDDDHDHMENDQMERYPMEHPQGLLSGSVRRSSTKTITTKDEYDEIEGLEFDDVFKEQKEEYDEPAHLKGPRRRGQDHGWIKVMDFDSVFLFHKSGFFKEELKPQFNMRKMKTTLCSERETYECKYARKRGYTPCPVKYKIVVDNSLHNVVVEKAGEEHEHKQDPNLENVENPNYFRWTQEQTAIVLLGWKNNLNPRAIKRNMLESNLFVGRFPTSLQLSNKIATFKTLN